MHDVRRTQSKADACYDCELRVGLPVPIAAQHVACLRAVNHDDDAEVVK